jgi:hypothetical protein
MTADGAMTAALGGVPNSVEVISGTGEWFVRVTENDATATSAAFELESFALSYAEGQRIRLGLASVLRG